MKTTDRRKIYFLCTVPSLGESMGEVLGRHGWDIQLLDDAEVLASALKADQNDDAVPVMLYTDDQRGLEHWQWDVVRANYLNPVLVFGYEEEADYIRFHRECVIYSPHHAYSPIPADITQLLTRLARMVPVEDHLVKDGIINECSAPHKRLHLSLHSFKVKPGKVSPEEMEEVGRILERIKSYFDKRGDKKICKRIDVFLSELAASRITPGNIGEIKKYLEEELKRI